MLIDALFFAVGVLHVLIAPYTKVEESFNLHATHDVLMYGIMTDALKNYDHFTWPGVVPRSFIGSVLLAWISTPVLRLLQALNILRYKSDIQVIVRLVLASLNACGLVLVRRAVTKRFGPSEGYWFVVLSCTQFHVPFWMGRTLPNMFAFFPVNVALSLLVATSRRTARDKKLALAILTITGITLRAELALLLASLTVFILIRRHLSLTSVISTGLMSAAVGIGLTVVVDSYFWKQPMLWPEFSGLYFNVVEGKSAEWGVSPRHTYFSAHLPKLLLGSLPLSLLGCLVGSGAFHVVLPAIAYIVFLSQIGHKEWRFIVYVVPMFNIAAAQGAAWIFRRKTSLKFIRGVFGLGVLGLVVGNVLVTGFMTVVSHVNYPGGEALSRLHTVVQTPKASIFIDNLAAQTGASLFLQECSPPIGRYGTKPPLGRCEWVYHKNETASSEFSHGILESAEIKQNKGGKSSQLERVQALERVKLIKNERADAWVPYIPSLKLMDVLWIVEYR